MEVMAASKASMIHSIKEEIEIERQKPTPDQYVVSRLSGLVERASNG
ncbi:hypothetical protein VCHA31O73_360054 [Vibrio chagasii]|nr:hypothetical protein VCHA31O73_360054 [Vibrio chagasii]